MIMTWTFSRSARSVTTKRATAVCRGNNLTGNARPAELPAIAPAPSGIVAHFERNAPSKNEMMESIKNRVQHR